MKRFSYRWKRLLAYLELNMKNVSEITGLAHQTIKQYTNYEAKGLEESIKVFERLTDEGTKRLKPPFQIPEQETPPGLDRLTNAIKYMIKHAHENEKL